MKTMDSTCKFPYYFLMIPFEFGADVEKVYYYHRIDERKVERLFHTF